LPVSTNTIWKKDTDRNIPFNLIKSTNWQTRHKYTLDKLNIVKFRKIQLIKVRQLFEPVRLSINVKKDLNGIFKMLTDSQDDRNKRLRNTNKHY